MRTYRAMGVNVLLLLLLLRSSTAMVVGVALATSSTVAAEQDSTRAASVPDAVSLIGEYCLKCHAPGDSPAGDVVLKGFETPADLRADSELWLEARRVLDTGDMPPPKSARPTDAERRLMIRWIDTALSGGPSGIERDPGRPVMRRLTRLEYNNTMRDLLGVDVDIFPFPERLPLAKDYFRPEESR